MAGPKFRVISPKGRPPERGMRPERRPAYALGIWIGGCILFWVAFGYFAWRWF